MERKRDGFVTIGDVAGAVQLSSGRGLTPVAPDAPRHFTKLDQVDQFVRASEAEADVGFMARLLALCRLRRTNLSDRREYRRVNGPFRLYMQAGPETESSPSFKLGGSNSTQGHRGLSGPVLRPNVVADLKSAETPFGPHGLAHGRYRDHIAKHCFA